MLFALGILLLGGHTRNHEMMVEQLSGHHVSILTLEDLKCLLLRACYVGFLPGGRTAGLSMLHQQMGCLYLFVKETGVAWITAPLSLSLIYLSWDWPHGRFPLASFSVDVEVVTFARTGSPGLPALR